MKKIIELVLKNKLYLALTIVGVLAVISLILVISVKVSSTKAQVITSSTLMNVINIYETTGAGFTYNGIAEAYKDAKKEKVKCYIKYNATVKASISTKNVKFEIDQQNKTVKIILPEIYLTPILKENEFSYIPEKSNIELKEVISICKADVKMEAEKSTELRETAEKNIKETIRALIYGLVKAKGYEVI